MRTVASTFAIALCLAACGSFSGSDATPPGSSSDGGDADGASRVDAGVVGPLMGGDGGFVGDGRDTVIATNEHTVYAIGTDGTSLYWAQNTSGLIRRMPSDGSGNATTFCDTKASPEHLAVGANVLFFTLGNNNAVVATATDGTMCKPMSVSYAYPRALALGTNKLYFIESSGSDGVAVDTAARTGVVLDAKSARAVDPGRPIDIVFDGTSVFWLDTGTCAIKMLDETLTVVVPVAQAGQDCRALAVAAGKVYWTSHQDETIYVSSTAMGSSAAPYAKGEAGLGPIVADAAGVYWLNTNAGTLRTKAAGGAVDIAAGDNQAGAPIRFHGLALDSRAVFRASYSTGEIKRWRRAL